MLRASAKFLLAFNESISSAKQYNTECYTAYFVLKDYVLEKAKYGQRFRFVTYQPAFVANIGSDIVDSNYLNYDIKSTQNASIFYKRLIPHALKEGTVVKVIVPKESENCAIL